MKKYSVMCLLAMMIAGGSMSYANPRPDNDKNSVTSSSAVSKDIAELCSALDKALEALKTNPSDLSGFGNSMNKSVGNLDTDQKLTSADKALLKKTMYNLMEVVVSIQMEQNPQMAQIFGNLTEDQKKEMMGMAMKVATQELDNKIDSCETLGDFTDLAGKI